MPIKNYWDKRFEQINKNQFKKGDDFYNDLKKQYKIAEINIQKDIDHWYNRLAINNNVSMAEAEKMLQGNELNEFKWTVEEYIVKGKENAINQKYIRELENASTKVHVTRLESIKTQMGYHVANVMDHEEKGLRSILHDVYTEGYYKTSFELQKAIGIGKELYRLDTDKIEKIISKPWAKDGKNFSERIWGDHRGELNRLLEEGLTQVISSGLGKDEFIKKLSGFVSEDFEDAKYAARRLVNSEISFFNSCTTYDSYVDNGVKKYKIVAALELGKGRKTCNKCADKDGKVYDISEWEIGKTAPLFHSNCRCTTAPKMDNAITRNAERTRAAKIEGINNGKTVSVDNVSFKEWEQRFVKSGANSIAPKVDKDYTGLRNSFESLFKNISKKGAKTFTSDEVFDAVKEIFAESVANSAESGIIKEKNESKFLGKKIVDTDNQSIREWYVVNVSDIPNQIDKSKSFEEQVEQAFALRNKYKHEARIAMSDKETAEILEIKRPTPTFEQLLQSKMERKNMTREEALEDILKTASKTNEDVNKEFGL